MEIYDIAVIGAGPAGCMAAIQGAKMKKKVILLEKNDKIGKKLLLTGHGKCNLTNSAPMDIFLKKYGDFASFYQNVFNKFSNDDLIDFFESNGLELIEKEEGRIFPSTMKSKSVVDTLKKILKELDVQIRYNYQLQHIQKQSAIFKLISTKNDIIRAKNVILATGGASYQFTGSSGDGYKIAENLGHHISKLQPGGVPLVVREEWVGQLKGVNLEKVGLKIQYGSKIMVLPRGDLLFTLNGVSGPVILDMSQKIINLLHENGDLKLYIDFLPDIERNELHDFLIEDSTNQKQEIIKNYLKNIINPKIVDPFLNTVSIDPLTKLEQISENQRWSLVETLKGLPLTIIGHLDLDKALVTCGGILVKEINPQTMESNIVLNLYFAGEIIEGCGRRGGYNLQKAFSTGYVAANNASKN